MTHPTYADIAQDWTLWREYVDLDACMTIEEWEAMSIPDRIALQIETFGPEPEPVPTVEEMLERTHIGHGYHEWRQEGGAVRVSRAGLLPYLQYAYDRTNPNWPALVEL